MGVREGLLALLDRESAYGYQLKTGFESATGGIWSLNVGQVYATLDRLERDGFVTSVDTDGQRSYRITPAGSHELGAWWEAVPGDEPPPRDELTVKVLLAIAHDREHALDVIAHQRDSLLMLLQQHRRSMTRRTAKSHDPIVEHLVQDALIVRAEADLRWLDLCEERLAPPPKQPTGVRDDGEAETKRARVRTRITGKDRA
jgi:DNA-binding PadR family transcriptional regulator